MDKQDLKLIRGDDNQIKFWLRVKPDKQLLDLTGCRIDLHAVDSEDETQVVLQCSTETGDITVLGAGEVLLMISHSMTANAEWERALYDVQLTDSQGLRHTVLYGKISLYHDRTRV